MKKKFSIALKQISLFFLLLIGVVSISTAKEVKPETAKTIAQNFYDQINIGKAEVKLKLFYAKKTSLNKSTLKEDTLFYIFKADENNGFIIVSGDDRITPILGYSTTGTFYYSNIPPNLKMWLDNYEKQIENIISNNVEATDVIKSKWERLEKSQPLYTLESTYSVSPLISANWNQGLGWNEYCPSDPDAPHGKTSVGCVAVAMGQIMKKWEDPIEGRGSNSYDHPIYGTLSADFGNSTYNWSLMDNNSANQYSAFLLYHCGVSVYMNYGPNGSGARSDYVRDALVYYFNYSSDARYIHRSSYTTLEWKNVLTSELDNDRPIYYTGGTHAFVCDGYESDDYFHFNWGWGGAYNGYFYLDDLTPGSQILNSDQSAIIGIWSNKLDDDNDGVANHLDKCQNTSTGETVDKNGCSIDQSKPMFFVTTWKTDNQGASNSTSITIPMVGSGYDVDWDNDGVIDEYSLKTNLTHDYGEEGNYTVRIFSESPRISFFSNNGDRKKILSIDQWGTGCWKTMGFAFFEAVNLELKALDNPNLSEVTDMSNMFYHISSINEELNNWDVSNVIDMGHLFADVNSFNQDLNNWDVSNVTDMSRMFYKTSFNKDINNWNVSNVTNMEGMFSTARSFNQELKNWNVSNVTNMSGMFANASSFNQDISNWDVSNVKDMGSMFLMWNGETSFNQDISAWDVRNVTNMGNMFFRASLFNQDLSGWNVSNVTDMNQMFYGVTLSTDKYDDILNTWSQLSLKNDVSFSAGYSSYCNSDVSRNKLINDYGWTIVDGGLDCSSLGIPELDIFTFIYPNPAKDQLMISSKFQLEKVEFYSILGKKVKEITEDFKSVDLSNLSKGMYIIRVYSEKGATVKKLIKQ